MTHAGTPESSNSPGAAVAAPGPLFSCRGVTKSFYSGGEAHEILSDITVDIDAGEFIAIVGGSGVGKTTLLRMLGGLMPCTSGVIEYRGAPVNGPPPDVVLVFQDYSRSLLPWRTVEDNIGLGLEAAHVKGDERRSRIDRVLSLVGLEEARKRRPWELSGGMQQRVQIARALAVEPAVLLMDEPFGSLDAMTKAHMQNELLALQADTGTTVIFITHDVDEAIYLSDRTLVMKPHPGRVAETMEIDLPRPRRPIETRELPRFLELRHHAHEQLEH